MVVNIIDVKHLEKPFYYNKKKAVILIINFIENFYILKCQWRFVILLAFISEK